MRTKPKIGFVQGRLSPMVNNRIQQFPWDSWRHECDQQNKPSSHVWQGRPDVYHALNACLISKSKADLISFVHPI